MAKGELIRAIMGMKHSPAGKKYLADKGYAEAEVKAGKNKKISLRTQGIESKLKLAGLSDAQIRRLRGSKSE